MNWAELLRRRATSELQDTARTSAGIFDRSPSSGWDPYEVWLSRVKQPREQAATARTGTAEESFRSSAGTRE